MTKSLLNKLSLWICGFGAIAFFVGDEITRFLPTLIKDEVILVGIALFSLALIWTLFFSFYRISQAFNGPFSYKICLLLVIVGSILCPVSYYFLTRPMIGSGDPIIEANMTQDEVAAIQESLLRHQRLRTTQTLKRDVMVGASLAIIIFAGIMCIKIERQIYDKD